MKYSMKMCIRDRHEDTEGNDEEVETGLEEVTVVDEMCIRDSRRSQYGHHRIFHAAKLNEIIEKTK